MTIQDSIEEKLKSKSYTGTHKRQSTMNHPGFESTMSKMWTTEAAAHITKGGFSRHIPQKSLMTLTSDPESTSQLKVRHTGSFEDKSFKHEFHQEKGDSRTEYRNGRGNGIIPAKHANQRIQDPLGEIKDFGNRENRRISGNIKPFQKLEDDNNTHHSRKATKMNKCSSLSS